MRKNLVLLSFSAVFALNMSADTLGFEAGAAVWGAKHLVLLNIKVTVLI